MKAVRSILKVVEVENGQMYLGQIEVSGDRLTVYSGMPGRPKVIALDEVESIKSAWLHPDVEYS